jgi:quercetin dioxygenase-like cupin family protein
MLNKTKLLYSILTLSLMMLVSGAASGQEMTGHRGQNIADMKFVNVPGLPTCASASVQNGDPSKGPSFILAKTPAGCSIPWHWHTPNEHLMMVSGSARLDMKDGKSLTLQGGGFAVMPAREVHQFRCLTACMLYIYSDVAFDIHYVDKSGNEITPVDAMKAVKETAATEMKEPR